MRKYIPPGYHDIAHKGLNESIKNAGEIATRRHAAGFGRLVDPDDSDAGIGTANIGFAHSQSLVATDFTPFGHHRAFLFHLFSGGLRIAGGDVKIMLDLHSHAFELYVLHFEHAHTHTHTSLKRHYVEKLGIVGLNI